MLPSETRRELQGWTVNVPKVIKRLNYGLQQIYQSAIACEQAGQLLCRISVAFDVHGSAVLPVAAAALSGTHPSPSSPSMTTSFFINSIIT